MLLQFVQECLVIDIETKRGLAPVPTRGLERFEQELGFRLAGGLSQVIDT